MSLPNPAAACHQHHRHQALQGHGTTVIYQFCAEDKETGPWVLAEVWSLIDVQVFHHSFMICLRVERLYRGVWVCWTNGPRPVV